MSDTDMAMLAGQCMTCGRPMVTRYESNCVNCHTDKQERMRKQQLLRIENQEELNKQKEAERSTPIQVSTQLEMVCKALEPLDNDARSRVLRAAAVLFAIPGGLGGGR